MRFKHNNYGFHTNKAQFSQDWGCSQQCNKIGDLTSTLFTYKKTNRYSTHTPEDLANKHQGAIYRPSKYG